MNLAPKVQERNFVGLKQISQKSSQAAPMPERESRLRYKITFPKHRKKSRSNPVSANTLAKVPKAMRIPQQINVVSFMQRVCAVFFPSCKAENFHKIFSSTSLSNSTLSIKSARLKTTWLNFA